MRKFYSTALALGLIALSPLANAASSTIKFQFNTPIVYDGKSYDVSFMPMNLPNPNCTGTKAKGTVICHTDETGKLADGISIYIVTDRGAMPIGYLSAAIPNDSEPSKNFIVATVSGTPFDSAIGLSTQTWTGGDQLVYGMIKPKS